MRGIPRTTVNLLKPDQDHCSSSKTSCRIKLGEPHVLSCALSESPRSDKRIHQDQFLLSLEWICPTIARAASNDFLALMDLLLFFKHFKDTEAHTKLENVSCWIKLRSLSLNHFAVPKQHQ